MSLSDKIEACISDIKSGLCCPRIHGCEQNDSEFCLVRQAFERAGLLAEGAQTRTDVEPMALPYTIRRLLETLSEAHFAEPTDNGHDRAQHGVEVMEHIEAEILALFEPPAEGEG